MVPAKNVPPLADKEGESAGGSTDYRRKIEIVQIELRKS